MLHAGLFQFDFLVLQTHPDMLWGPLSAYRELLLLQQSGRDVNQNVQPQPVARFIMR
jgi:hypothetical protein